MLGEDLDYPLLLWLIVWNEIQFHLHLLPKTLRETYRFNGAHRSFWTTSHGATFLRATAALYGIDTLGVLLSRTRKIGALVGASPLSLALN